jgi:hypothetical protein
MPLISRIEVSNFMNSRREDPWRPDWTFQTFDLKGENAAINMPNGRGKSTLALAILALLAHDKSLHELRKNHFAPQSTGHFTHIRIETRIWVEDDSPGDLVVQSGGDAGGVPMVFGLHGNSGESGSFKVYAYRGTLEDCTVGRREGNRVTLTGNKDFLEKLSVMPGRFPATQRDDTRVNWREHVAGIFDMPSIEQQLVYQKAKGAEGSSGYFDVNPPRGRQFAEAVFYERLAPELLVEMMGGVEEYADERGIEDVIHQKVQGIIKAKVRTAKTADDLEKTRRVLEELERVKTKADALVQAKDAVERKVEEFSLHHAALKAVVVDDPIPGLLRQPPEDAPVLIRSMVMQGGKWYLPDRAFEIFTGELPKHINERAARQRIEIVVADKSQLIDFACDRGSSTVIRQQGGGDSSKLYSNETALALLSATTNFKSPYTRDSATQLVSESFEWVEAHGDTNPARLERRELKDRESKANARRGELTTRRDALQNESRLLKDEQQQIGQQQAEFRRMSDSGLFSESELSSPAATGLKVDADFAAAENRLTLHRQNVAGFRTDYQDWQEYVSKRGEDFDPEEYAELLARAKGAAERSLSANKNELDEALKSASATKTVAESDKESFKTLSGKADKVKRLQPQTEAYVARFGDANPEGLLRQVKQELADAERRLGEIRTERSAMEDALSSLVRFSSLHGKDANPKAWLENRSTERDRLSVEMGELRVSIKDSKARRADLDKAAVAPGKVAREVLGLGGTDAKPLYAFVDEMNLPQDRKERVLSLFSALLFSPVYESQDRAAEVAKKLASAGVESPVFVSSELAEYCRAANVAYDGSVARTWLVGVRTRPVDCLLDPTFVEREKELLDRQIEAQEAAHDGKLERFNELDPEGAESVDSRKAREALEKGFPKKDSMLKSEADEIEETIPRLKDRASEEAEESIRAVLEFRLVLGDSTVEELAEALAQAENAANLSSDRFLECEGAVETLRDRRESLQSALNEASVKATEIPKLKRIGKFIDAGGPSLMRNAASAEKELLDLKSKAKDRTDFRFDLAESFVKSGENRPKEIELRLAAIAPELADIVDTKIPQIDGICEDIGNRLPDLEALIVEVDGFVRELRKKHREMVTTDCIPVSVASERIAEHPLSAAALGVRQASSPVDVAKALLAMRSPLEDIDASNMSRDVMEARRSLKDAREGLLGEIDRVKGDSTIALNEQMRIGLECSKDDVGELVRMLDATTENFNKSKAANETAHKHLEQEWNNIGSWLENFTRRLPTNFETMRSVFKPVRDSVSGEVLSAGFEVEARVADLNDVRIVLTGIVDKVERGERNRENLGDDEGLRARYDRNMRKEIREEFYKSVILEPTIRVCIPSISHKSLKLEKNMVSSGQGVAMSLLWIVKMADYVTERELQRQNVSAAKRKRVRSMKTQFVIIDGAFSHLSDKRLIRDALDSVKRKRGEFQLIVTGHEPNYKNDFAYFPSYVVAREIGGNLMYAESETRRLLAPEEVGSRLGAMEVSSFHKLTDAA